jgi:hypothetical protein
MNEGIHGERSDRLGRALKPLQLSWWEFVLALPLVGVIFIFVLARAYVSAAVLLSVTALLVAWRAEIVERNVAGGYARARGWVLATQWSAMAVVYLIIVGVLFVASHDHWTHTRQGTVAEYASVGLSFFLAREMMRHGVALDFLAGGEAERRVASALDPLRSHGWDVVHDTKKDWGGNVDHLVLAPRMAFAIETKSGVETGRARSQALSNAAWAKQKYGRPWVNAVLCVLRDAPPTPKKVGQAWVTGPDDLPVLLEQPSRHLTSLKFAANTRNARLASE